MSGRSMGSSVGPCACHTYVDGPAVTGARLTTPQNQRDEGQSRFGDVEMPVPRLRREKKRKIRLGVTFLKDEGVRCRDRGSLTLATKIGLACRLEALIVRLEALACGVRRVAVQWGGWDGQIIYNKGHGPASLTTAYCRSS